MKSIFLIALSLLFITDGFSQEVFKKSLASAGISKFAVSNFSGGIEITENTGSSINIKATLLEGQMPKNTHIDFKQEADYLLVFLRTPCSKEASEIDFDPQNPDGILYQKPQCDQEEELPKIKITVSLPKAIQVYAFTIMDGDIEVANMNSALWLKNINGNIKISYREKPSLQASCFSVNGNIEVGVPSGTSTTANFKSFHGDFYTDLAEVDVAPSMTVEKNKTDGFKYRLERKQELKINGGGTLLDFDTINGDVYLLANKN